MIALDIRYAGRISLFLYENAADADDTDPSAPAPCTPTPRPPAPSSARRSRRRSAWWRTNRNHVILSNGVGPPATSFMNEGMASAVMSERYHPGGKSFLYPWTARNDARIPPIYGEPLDQAEREWRTFCASFR